MNIQVSAKTFTSSAALLADHAAVRRRLFGRAPVNPVGTEPVDAEPLITVRRRLPAVNLHFHDAHVRAYRRWQMIAANGPCTAHILKRCAEARVSYEAVIGPCRKHRVAQFRHLLMWEIKTMVKPTISYPELGRLFGGRDHTTALHGVRAHAERIMSKER
ncbi:helix-turn-helix domain-containing protein [Shinella sp.]|uniref:helix-turn-helix domain-containing protein n=1 Tax=Shinella sp. TaxID=1870904 RepID=UPI003D28677E